MQLLLSEIIQSRTYALPSDSYLSSCLIRIVGGKAITQGTAMAYWLKPIIITPLVKLEDELVALPVSYQCSLQRTFIKLPINTSGLNLYIPTGTKINLYGTTTSQLISEPQYLEV
jgi:hypothetical protein